MVGAELPLLVVGGLRGLEFAECGLHLGGNYLGIIPSLRGLGWPHPTKEPRVSASVSEGAADENSFKAQSTHGVSLLSREETWLDMLPVQKYNVNPLAQRPDLAGTVLLSSPR